MHRNLLLALIATLVPALATAEGEKEVQYGKYVCITDRSVGLQTPENGTQRYAGSIQMSPERQRFFATISKIGTVPLNGPQSWIKDGVVQHVPERCFSPENIQKLEEQWQRGSGMNYMGPNVQDFAEWCLAKSAIQITIGDLTEKYYSIGKNVFLTNFGDRFWISNGWRFTWSFNNFAGDYYMMEGRCDLIK